jgi:Transposase DDE domain
VARWGYTRMADMRVSTTDPDASPMHQKKKSSGRLGYLTHYAVDGGKARVILNVLVTAAEVTENLPMLEMLFRSTFRWRLRPRSATGDAAYGTRENITAIEEAGIRAYAALPDQGKRTSLFTIEDFVYDAEKDVYTCPAGETLHRRGHDHRGGYVRYSACASSCNRCPLKSGCTKGPKGRWLSRGLQEQHLERVRAYRRTEAYRKALRKRAVWPEPLFAEAKEWHGSRRFRLRGLEKVNAEALMIASGQNVKRLLAFGPRGPRKTATVAALRPPEKPSQHPIRRHRTARARRGFFQRAGEFCELPLYGVLRSSSRRGSRKSAREECGEHGHRCQPGAQREYRHEDRLKRRAVGVNPAVVSPQEPGRYRHRGQQHKDHAQSLPLVEAPRYEQSIVYPPVADDQPEEASHRHACDQEEAHKQPVHRTGEDPASRVIPDVRRGRLVPAVQDLRAPLHREADRSHHHEEYHRHRQQEAKEKVEHPAKPDDYYGCEHPHDHDDCANEHRKRVAVERYPVPASHGQDLLTLCSRKLAPNARVA